jgi:[glutamine synthetase] adenylyltransferase / [glutamine synthetase]-adenylyl-L-tyrosine phosphorylase
MNLLPRYSSIEQAWERYLQFSVAARTFVGAQPEKLKPEEWFQPRSPKRWTMDWKNKIARADSSQKPMDVLRLWQKSEMVRLGFFECATDISIQDATASLSQLADFCLQQTLEIVSRDLHLKSAPQDNTLAIIGLGKLGGYELNYSSDIDIVFIYGEELDFGTKKSSHQFYNDYAKRIAQDLAAKSACGQLYRVDLRLRPEGDKGPLARSIESCENYYAEFGEMWERLAMLKARFCAGNQETAYEFQQMIQPFCYARSMVPDLLAEIAFLKARTEKEIVGDAEQNYHVKLGRGGIRDIEFFVQGQQLLHGSRQPYLQRPNTLKTLEALLNLNLIDREKFHLLSEAYIFWRRLEHRLQIIDHRQTHLLPRDVHALHKIAHSLGYENGEILWNEQMRRREAVRPIYDAFYEGLERKKNSSEDCALHASHFQNPEQAQFQWKSLTGSSAEFHISRRTLESFERLAPHLSKNLGESLRPDLALTQFASFVQVYGSRSLLYESLASNANALKLLLRLFDSSQYLGGILRSSPEIFEEVARQSLNEEGNLDIYLSEMRASVKNNDDAMSALRRYKRHQIVRIALRWLLGLTPLEKLCEEMSDLADACLQVAWEALGKPELAAISLGKHGGKELGFGSDLDLLFVGKDIHRAQEWIRFMTEKTSAGALFSVDTRLRPYAEGAVTRSLEVYENYYREHAQLWEIQALTRARFTAGHSQLGEHFIRMAKNIWREHSQKEDLSKKILEMRKKVEEGRCKSGKPELEFKTGKGGMMDIEFAVQYWQMKNNVFEPVFKTALAQFIQSNKGFEKFAEHYHFLRHVEVWLRFDLNLSISHLPAEAKGMNYIAQCCGFCDSATFLARMQEIRSDNRYLFHQLLK